jgi:hypothetical protein
LITAALASALFILTYQSAQAQQANACDRIFVAQELIRKQGIVMVCKQIVAC